MSTTRVLPRLAVAIGAVLAVAWVASPAFAADAIDTSISGLSSSMSAGARGADTFRTNMQNKTDNEILPVRRVLVVRLTGLTPDFVRIFRGPFALQAQAGGQGEVRAADPLQVRLAANGKTGDSSRQDYGLQFLAGAPNGKAQVIFQAYRGDQLLGSSSRDVTIKGGVAQPSASHSPTPTPDASSPVAGQTGPGAGPAVAPLTSQKALADVSGSGGVPVVFYVLGAILVGVGGVILWLLFRPRPATVAGSDYPTGPYLPVQPAERPPTLGYPTVNQPRHASANPHPTTVMPAVHDPSKPPPPVDPWASQAGGPSGDTTRGFGPPRQ